MRKKICVAVVAVALLMSSCARIPGIDRLDRGVEDASASAQVGQGDGETSDRGKEVRKGNDTEADSQSLEIHGEENGGLSEDEAANSEDDESKDSYVKGTITDDGWESAYWNLRYTAPEGLYMLNEEGLDALMGLSEEMLSENYTERQQEYIKLTTLYEMVSMTATGDANAAVTVEKLLVKGMTTEDYKKAALLQLRLVQNPAYEILDDSGTAEIAGETYAVVATRAEAEDGGAYFQDYYFRVEGERALILLVTYAETTADIAGEILSGFDVYESR